MENTKNIEAQSALTPPLKSIVVNGKKKVAVNGVVNINASSKGGVQPDWNQNDATKPDYIKNRPFYEEVTPLFPDTTFKYNEQGSLPSIVLETDEPVLVDGDTVEFTSLNPELEVRYGGSSFSPDGKSGSFGFSVYDLNGQTQGGGGGNISFDGVTGKYLFAISGSGNPNVVANLEFTMTRQRFSKLNGKSISTDTTLSVTDGKLGVNYKGTPLTNYFAKVTPYNSSMSYSDSYFDLTSEGIVVTPTSGDWSVRMLGQVTTLPTGNQVGSVGFEVSSNRTNTFSQQVKTVATIKVEVDADYDYAYILQQLNRLEYRIYYYTVYTGHVLDLMKNPYPLGYFVLNAFDGFFYLERKTRGSNLNFTWNLNLCVPSIQQGSYVNFPEATMFTKFVTLV